MSWASIYIKQLKDGNTVQFRPKGSSMKGKIESGQLVTVVPRSNLSLDIGDVVLCRVSGKDYLHLISATKTTKNGLRFQISNNKGYINGWIGQNQIFGKLVDIE